MLKRQWAKFVSYFDMHSEANHGPQHYQLGDARSAAAYRPVADRRRIGGAARQA